MKIKRKFLIKVFVIFFAAYFLFQPLLAGIVLAEESEPTPIPTEVNSQTTSSDPTTVQDPSPTPEQASLSTNEAMSTPDPTIVDPTVTPTPDSSIDTGDANSSASTQTDVNNNQSNIPGSIDSPGGCVPPEGQTTCPENTNIENNNLSEVNNGATSGSETGENQINGTDGNVSIDTGNATSTGEINNQNNTNQINLDSSSATHSGDTSSTPTELNVDNNNEATAVNSANIGASTGENQANQNAGDVQVSTGDALAIANLLNILNMNVVGSKFTILYLTLAPGQSTDINLNELWKQLLTQDPSTLNIQGELSFVQISIQNTNEANLQNNVNVSAGTGGNQANQNKTVVITTGRAIALANVANIVNTNILGSTFLFGVVNIYDGTANLILPRPEMFQSESSTDGSSGAVFENQNEAEITDQVNSTADSGTNTEDNNFGGSLLTTGNATANANIFTLANLDIFKNNWFMLFINNLGLWNGQVLNWTAPGSIDAPQITTQIYQIGFNSEPSLDTQNVDPNQILSFQNFNQANVQNNIQTQASTGLNQASNNSGSASIKTGNAFSLANLFNLINLNILGGRWFMGLVNILGGWTGNAIFAYPDLAVSISSQKGQVTPGEDFGYDVNYKNIGYDDALNAHLNLQLPFGVTYSGDNSGVTPSVSGQNISWNLGNIKMKEGGSFVIQVKVNSDFNFDQPVSWFSKLIPQAYAAENQKEEDVTADAQISTSDPDSNNGNNNSAVTTLVYLPFIAQSSASDQASNPALEVSAWNNVNQSVNAGDTVTFEVTVKNSGDVTSNDTKIVHRLFNKSGIEVGEAEFNLGTVESGKTGKLSFGLKLVNDGSLESGSYYTLTQALGKSSDGKNISSNEARTDFKINGQKLVSSGNNNGFEQTNPGEVLAANANSPEIKRKNNNFLPYALFFLISSLSVVTWMKAKLKE